MTTSESQLEEQLLEKLRGLKYAHRADIRDRAALELNFRKKFDELNHVRLTDGEFQRLLDEIVTPDVFTAAHTIRNRNSFTRDDGTPLNFTLVNIPDWCKNTFEVVSQLRINTDNSHHRYDVLLLINGVPVVQIELKTLAISPRRAIEQIVEYKNDPGNGYTRTLLCFIQLFVVSNRNDTWYFANNNARHFSFNADERFLPIYQHADEENKKITHIDTFAEKFLAKCTLGQMVSRYMVLVASEQKLLMMRPYQRFKDEKAARELSDISAKHGLPAASLQAFVDAILMRKIFDGEQLTELLEPLDLGWKARAQKELALMTDLVPLLKRRAGGREISGLKAYEGSVPRRIKPAPRFYPGRALTRSLLSRISAGGMTRCVP